MIVPVMAISNLVLTRQIYSEETNGAHAHYREPVPLTAIVYFISTYYFGYDWIITIVGYSQHELSTINMLYSLRKDCHITPLPPNGHLSTTTTFFCPQVGRCGDVRL